MKKYTNRIAKNKSTIERLLNENVRLMYLNKISQANSFSFVDKNVGSKKNPDIINFKIMHYIQKFKDEDSGKFISIDRQMFIERDGNPCDEWGILLPVYELENY